ncbi:MAG TPA: hypothetical protein VIP46_08750, partial [Pyrinomonadaceae bacterium]
MKRRKGGVGRAKGERANPARAFALGLPPFALPLFPIVFLIFAGCGVDDRRSGLPAGAQDAIDRLTEHYAEGRFAEIYAEAAGEWRAAVAADESR